MSSIGDDLEQWFTQRPVWLQDATCRLLENNELTETDYGELVRICGNEAGVNFEGQEIPKAQVIPPDSLFRQENINKVELSSISNILGVNALNPRNPLELSKGLTIVYGQNGSGKSGYTRLLKQICGAKTIGELHSNAFVEETGNQSCSVKYSVQDNELDLDWDISQGINEHLSAIEIYDSFCGSVYVTEENQLAYEPELLRLFTQLTLACDNLSVRLDKLSNELVSAKPQLPIEYNATRPGSWYNSITVSTKNEAIVEQCKWDKDEQKKLDALNIRLKTPDPKESAKKTRKSAKQVDELVKGFRNWNDKLSDDGCAAYLQLKKDYSVKYEASTTYAKSIFESVPLNGIGEDVWKLLWEQARLYSEQVAYTDTTFPNLNDDALCVLCQQPLDIEARKRLSSFEKFVKGELEEAANKAKQSLDEKEKSLKKTPEESLINTIITAARLDDTLSKKCNSLRESIVQNTQNLLETEIDKEFTSDIDFRLLMN